jgi:hypothetical protein
MAQIIKPAVADAAGQAEYAADRITREAVMPLAEAVAGQVHLILKLVSCKSSHTDIMGRTGKDAACSAQYDTRNGVMQAEPTAELVKERYVAPIAAIVKEQVCCWSLMVPVVKTCLSSLIQLLSMSSDMLQAACLHHPAGTTGCGGHI